MGTVATKEHKGVHVIWRWLWRLAWFWATRKDRYIRKYAYGKYGGREYGE